MWIRTQVDKSISYDDNHYARKVGRSKFFLTMSSNLYGEYNIPATNTIIHQQKMNLFGFFVYWYINLCGLFNAKIILVEKQWSYY